MRLLLLLSAILAALTGSGGVRASVQPVEASAARAPVAASVAAAVAAELVRPASVVTTAGAEPKGLVLRLAPAFPLYADRLLE